MITQMQMKTETPEEKEINDLIDQWHAGDGKIPLHEFLGMTWDEYCKWVKGV